MKTAHKTDRTNQVVGIRPAKTLDYELKREHKILHQKFVRYGANAKEWMRKCILLLPEIEKFRIWEQKGFGSIYEYAAKLAGMSRETVDDSLRILKKIEDKPALKRVAEQKGIGAVRPVVTIATVETQDFWAEKALQMSKHTLEVYIQELKKQSFINLDDATKDQAFRIKLFQNGISSNQVGLFEAKNEDFFRPGTAIQITTKNLGSVAEPSTHQINKEVKKDQRNINENFQSSAPKRTIIMQIEPQIADQLQKLKGENDWNELMKELLQLRSEKLEQTKPEPVKTNSRHVPNKIKKHVAARTNGICPFPGCIKPSQIFHHTQRFALEKVHDPDRLEGLCKEHERLAHLGLIENENLPPQFWRVRGEADQNQPKFKIDQLVQKYRGSG